MEPPFSRNNSPLMWDLMKILCCQNISHWYLCFGIIFSSASDDAPSYMYVFNNTATIRTKGIIWINIIYKIYFHRYNIHSLHINVNIDDKILKNISISIEFLKIIFKCDFCRIWRECIWPYTLLLLRSTKVEEASMYVILSKRSPYFLYFQKIRSSTSCGRVYPL